MQYLMVTCSRCGKRFKKSKYYVLLSDNHYCSDTCRNNGSKPKKSYKGEEWQALKQKTNILVLIVNIINVIVSVLGCQGLVMGGVLGMTK